MENASITKLLLLMASCLTTGLGFAQPIQQWVQGYNGPRNTNDFAVALAVDPFGNVYVTGSSEKEEYLYDQVLIAQDVEEVLPDLVTDVRHNLSVPKPRDTAARTEPRNARTAEGQGIKNEMPKRDMLTTKAVNYIELIPIMIQGMQEQQAENNALKEQLADQQQQLEELRQMVQRLGAGNTGAVTLTSSYLEQNNPNPVSGTTTIRYHIPNTAMKASLTLTNTKGQTIKTIQLVKSDTGKIIVNCSTLAAGTYNYSLALDGRVVDTKKLVILH